METDRSKGGGERLNRAEHDDWRVLRKCDVHVEQFRQLLDSLSGGGNHCRLESLGLRDVGAGPAAMTLLANALTGRLNEGCVAI